MTLLEQPPRPCCNDTLLPTLATARLVLRAPRTSDAKAIAALVNDRRIAENTARIPHPYAVEDADAFVATANAAENDAVFVITRNGDVIGSAGLAATADGQPPELGYWLGVAHWGQGYATEAVHAVIDFAFGELEHDALQAGARVTNPLSRRVLEKCGFQWTGVGLYRIRALGSSAPIDRFRLDRGIWSSLKSWAALSRAS